MLRHFRYVAVLALVMGMAGLARFLGCVELFFPEMLALAVGSWIAVRCPWRVSRVQFVLLPSLAALIGTLLLHSGLPDWSRPPLALAAVAVLLVTSRSTLAPVIPAALLPLYVQHGAWIYPLAVAALTTVLALGWPLMDRFLRHRPPLPNQTLLNPRQEWLFWAKLWLVAVLYLGLVRWLNQPFAAAPPLLVVLVEFSRHRAALRQHPVRIFAVMSVAAWLGAGSIWLALHCGLPHWLVAGMAAAVLCAVFEGAGLILPPAGAIALLPGLFPHDALLFHYPWQVMAGCAVLQVVSLAVFRWPEHGAGR